MSLEIDHVIICVTDLKDAVNAFEEAEGVISVPGGRHSGHGTGNRLVPLGDAYLELVAVVDPDEASRSEFGRWVAARAKASGADGLAIRTNDLETVCERRGLEPLAMSRLSAGGDELRWRIAGLERMVSDGLPFFIQWDMDLDQHPGRIESRTPGGRQTLGDVIVSGDAGKLEEWVRGVPRLRIEEGEPGVRYSID